MSELKKIPDPFYKGKVRDLYPVDQNSMLIVATDRVSAFDVVFNESVPDKGKILNRISTLWFDAIRKSNLPAQLKFIDHIITTDIGKYPEPYRNYPPFEGRSVLVKKTERIDYECVVRGYLSGSGWKDYQKSGTVCGHKLPTGLQQSQKLPEPIFTPATKEELGSHDVNVSVEFMQNKIGLTAKELETISIAIYKYAAEKMAEVGILLCDTKFEFGLLDGQIVLIDEVLTPDSSRYWIADEYRVGSTPPGYDKQYIRDYVENSGWDKSPPAPTLPENVIKKTEELYRTIQNKIESIL